jgi:hypothetical protein
MILKETIAIVRGNHLLKEDRFFILKIFSFKTVGNTSNIEEFLKTKPNFW